MAGADPEDAVIPLLEGAIAYLCLPRVNPPGGGPSLIGVKVFGDGVPTPAGAGKGNKKKKITSLRAASAAALAASKKAKPKTATPKAKARKGKQSKPLMVPSGGGTVAVASSPSPSPPRNRPPSPSPPAGAAGAVGAAGRKLAQAAAAAAKAKAAAERAASRAAAKLLRWDDDSLADLLGAHRALAATLLRFEQSLELTAAADSTTTANHGRRRLERNYATTERMDGGNDDDGDGDGNGDGDPFDEHSSSGEARHCRPPQPQRSAELFERADASLTAALAAAGVAVGDKLMTSRATGNDATPAVCGTGHGGRDLASPRPPSSSRASTPIKVAADEEHGGRSSKMPETATPMLLRKIIAPALACTVSSTGAADKGQEIRQPHDGSNAAITANPMAATGADPRTLAELYGMRCAAREGLRFPEGAFQDCWEAVAAVPEAPKLWAKAASLALQIASGAAERRGESMKARAEAWATEVRDRERCG